MGTSAGARASGPLPAERWAGFVRLLVVGGVAAFVAILLALLAIDPYDTGRTGIFRRAGLEDQFPAFAHASRARDPRFDSAIFGNSHVQQLNPERLDALTGLSVVSLTIPGIEPRDELDMLAWFMANRRRPPRAIVIGMDQYWCLPTARTSLRFPAWLYAARFPDYLVGLIRYRSFEAAAARLRYVRTGKRPMRPDGYWDYQPIYEKLGLSEREASHRKLATLKPFPVNAGGTYPGLDVLAKALAGLPAETAVVLVRAPVYRTAIPDPASPAGRTAAACGVKMRTVAEARPRTVLLDLLGRPPEVDDMDDFYDHDHYRDPVAARIETEIAATLARLGGGATSAGRLD